MGYEFQVSISAGGAVSLAELAERLCLTGRYAIETLLPDELTLRFAERPRQPHWPQDILLKTSGGGLYVLVHTGDDQLLLNDLKDIYGPAGQIKIEEL